MTSRVGVATRAHSWSVLLTIVVVLAPALAAAQEPVKSFDQLNTRLKAGDTVRVTDAQGREVKGKVLELAPSALTLDHDGPRTLQARDVQKVAQRKGHPIAKGALWGLLAGAVGGAVIGAGSGNDSDVGTKGGWAAAGAGIFGGIGAGVGAGVGALMPGKEVVVFRSAGAPGSDSARLSLTPVITPRTAGLRVSFAF